MPTALSLVRSRILDRPLDRHVFAERARGRHNDPGHDEIRRRRNRNLHGDRVGTGVVLLSVAGVVLFEEPAVDVGDDEDVVRPAQPCWYLNRSGLRVAVAGLAGGVQDAGVVEIAQVVIGSGVQILIRREVDRVAPRPGHRGAGTEVGHRPGHRHVLAREGRCRARPALVICKSTGNGASEIDT